MHGIIHGLCGLSNSAYFPTFQVLYDPSPLGVTYEEIYEKADALPEPIFIRRAARLLVRIQTSDAAVDDFLGVVESLAEEKRGSTMLQPE